MSDPLPAEIVVTELRDGVRYQLPRRTQRGSMVHALLVIFGVVFGIGFMAFWIGAVGSQIPWQNPFQDPEWMLLLFLGFGIMLLCMILRTIGQSVSRLIGHNEIELRGDTLHRFECWGWLRWGWQRPVRDLRRFDIGAAAEQDSAKVYPNQAAAVEFNALTPVWDIEESKPKPLAWGYPRAWLVPLANDLTRRCRLASEETAAPDPIHVTEEPLPNRAGFVDQVERPAGSKITMDVWQDEARLTMPPSFFRSGGMVLAVAGEELSIVPRNGTGILSWSRRQLAEIRVGRLVDSEGPDSFELQVRPHPGEGKVFRLTLSDEAEARWVATTLRRALQMPDTRQPANFFLERAEQPAGSRIVRQRSTLGVTLTVPRVGFRHADVRSSLLSLLVVVVVTGLVGACLYWFPDNFVFNATGLTPVWIFMEFLGVIGLICLEDALRRGYRRAVFQVAGETLSVQLTNLYGTHQHLWLRNRVADIRLGDHHQRLVGTFRNDPSPQPHWELQIHLETGEVYRLLEGYGDADLQWLATELRHALRVPKAVIEQCT
jgi:hypothetical protein